MRALIGLSLMASTLLAFAGMARSAEIRVLAVRATEAAIRPIAEDFARESGHRVVFTIDAPAGVLARIKANAPHDVVIVPEAAMDRLDREGIVNPESRARLANTGIGVVVRAGAELPNVSTPEAFKQALLAAASIVHGNVFADTSGEKIEQILAAAGIFETLKPKIRMVPGHDNSQALIAKGEIEIGLYYLSEIPDAKGVTLVGPVPAPLQTRTTYEAALLSDGSAVEAARAFIQFLASPDARPHWAVARLTPLADH